MQRLLYQIFVFIGLGKILQALCADALGSKEPQVQVVPTPPSQPTPGLLLRGGSAGAPLHLQYPPLFFPCVNLSVSSQTIPMTSPASGKVTSINSAL